MNQANSPEKRHPRISAAAVRCPKPTRSPEVRKRKGFSGLSRMTAAARKDDWRLHQRFEDAELARGNTLCDANVGQPVADRVGRCRTGILARVGKHDRAILLERYLKGLAQVRHTRTKTKSPQTNGICERFNKTILNEFYRVTFRKKLYHRLEELQADLDVWLKEYNEERTHQGRWCYGKTPMQTFLDSIPLAKEKMIAA